MATQAQLKKLNRLMAKAADAALKHGEASRLALIQFEEMYGDLPEEAGFFQHGTPVQQAAHIFNEIVSHGENPSDAPPHLIAWYLDELMSKGENEG